MTFFGLLDVVFYGDMSWRLCLVGLLFAGDRGENKLGNQSSKHLS